MLTYIYCQSLWLLTFIFFCVVFAYAHLNSYVKKQEHYFCLNFGVLFFSLASIIYTTILKRDAVVVQLELRPFYTFVLAQEQVEMYRTFFMNALLFVPIGLSMPYVLSRKPHRWIIVIPIVFGCLLSTVIEYSQYYYHLGRCETDDVIANTLGAAVGALSYLLYIRILKNREESLMNSKISENQKLLMNLCAKSLFNKDYDFIREYDCDELVDESVRQTVFTQIYSFVKENANEKYNKFFSQIIAKNIRVLYGHSEVHNAFVQNNIPYVVLKGAASSAYYNEPTLRMMGDIDILVLPQHIAGADAALKSIGFVTNENLDKDGHVAYKRRDGLVCELHRDINGIPKNESGDKIKEYFADLFDKAVEYNSSCGTCVVPSKFHHGLILLLHTASHLTNEGVGLRHLCDWAVFVNGFTSDEFALLFENALKEIGLWRFAKILTACCVKYLGCNKKAWASDVDDNIIDNITFDILNGGNFGMKDMSRYSQIKYISDRKSDSVAKNSPILQLFCSINEKTKHDFKFTNKNKILLPLGWLFTVFKYLYMVALGKRKLDTVATITGAKQRKEIYDQFKLFTKE